MLHESFYNIIAHNDECIYIYNTLSEAVLQAKDESILKDASQKDLLIKNGFLTEEVHELNQYKLKYYHQVFRNDFLGVVICPTMSCNLSCYYCFEGKKKKEFMQEETIENIIKFFANYKHKKIDITWFGGEPLLAFPIIEKLDQKMKAEEIKYHSTLITNGTLLAANIRERIKKLSLSYIQITLDGERETHDSKRYFANGKGTYDIIMQNLKGLLDETDIQIHIQINIDKNNYQSYEKIYLSLYEEYPQEIDKGRLVVKFNHIQDRTSFDYQHSCLEGNEHFQVIKYFNDLKSNAQRSLQLPRTVGPCMYRSIHSFAIGPNGNIYKCLELIDKEGYEIGNINDLMVSRKQIAECIFEDMPFDDPVCSKCQLLPICGGGCPLDRIKKEQGTIDSICPYYKDNMEELINTALRHRK